MKRSRFSEEQIVGILREPESGQKTTDLCRRYGISPATFYHWKSKFGGIDVSDAKRLKALEQENSRLKKLHRSVRPDDARIRARLRALAGERRRFGYRRLHLLLCREGIRLNLKKLRRRVGRWRRIIAGHWTLFPMR